MHESTLSFVQPTDMCISEAHYSSLTERKERVVSRGTDHRAYVLSMSDVCAVFSLNTVAAATWCRVFAFAY